MILADASERRSVAGDVWSGAMTDGVSTSRRSPFATDGRLDPRERGRLSDPALQYRLLALMGDHPVSGVWLGDYLAADRIAVLANLLELQQQGLCSSGIAFDASGPFLARVSRITARGLAWITG